MRDRGREEVRDGAVAGEWAWGRRPLGAGCCWEGDPAGGDRGEVNVTTTMTRVRTIDQG